MSSIKINSLSKTYPGSNTKALDNLTLNVEPGEAYGFLGSNGAGKSTTIRLLLNFIQPSSGNASIMGRDAVAESVAAKRHIGYLAGDVAMWPKATGYDIYTYLSKLHHAHDKEYLDTLIHRFEAEPHKHINELSKGNRQKIGIIQALMHQPEVLILDEPTSGLDPLMQEAFYDSLREAKSRGTAIFMSSHNLTEVQHVCDRVGIIRHGKLVSEQNVKNLDEINKPTFHLTFSRNTDTAKLKGLKSLRVTESQGKEASVRPTGSIAAALSDLAHLDIKTFRTEQIDLEETFLEYYEDKK